MDFTTSRRARTPAVRLLLTLLATAGLVLPAVLSGSAQASTCLPVVGCLPDTGIAVPVTPSIAGAGQITSTTPGLLCSHLDGVQGAPPVPCQDPLSVLDLTGLTQVVLTAVPADGWQLDGWTGCPLPQADGTCAVVGSLLDPALTAVEPVASFIPIPVPDVGNPLDTDAPTTRLLSRPAVDETGSTPVNSATFTFASVEKDGTTATPNATFECQLTGPGRPTEYAACTSPRTYSNLAPGAYAFSVHAVDAAGNRDATDETFAWFVAKDSTAPSTTLAGPTGWLLADYARFTLGADEPAAGYSCALDGSSRACSGTSAVLLDGLAAGTHTFTAAATDKAGNRDATPAAATFTVPRNDTALKHSSGWKQLNGTGHFLNTYSVTSRKGATLSTPAGVVKRIALVVGKGKRYGTVKVYLGKQLLKKVSLAATATAGQKIVPIATFRSPRRGTIKVVVATSGRKVVVEGLGIASR